MILRLSAETGSCVVVMVAGWGVGNITLPFAPQFKPGSRRMESCRSGLPHAVRRGDWIGTFELGSSVVLITPASLNTTPLVSPHEKVHYGQPVLRFASADRPLPSGV